MISFSGIDCGGKSTQIELLGQYMKMNGIKYKIIWSRGGYTPVLEAIKTIIRKDKHYDDKGKEANDYRESIHSNPKKRKLLLWVSIFDLALYYGIYFRLIALNGYTILADRYFWDSYIDFKLKYAEIKFEKWLVWKFANAIYQKPQYSIIYTIPASISIYRSTLKKEPWPETEKQREERILLYLKLIKEGRWKYIINATASIDNVAEQTRRIIGL